MDSLPLALSEWPQDVQKRFQDTTPTIFGCTRAVFQKCLFSIRNARFFLRNSSGNPNLSVCGRHREPSGLKNPKRSLGNTPSALHEKQQKSIFSLFSALFFLFSALFSLPLRPPEVQSPGGMAKKRVGPPLAASFGDLWRPLWVCLLSSLLSLLFSLFSLRSSLSSLLSSLFSLSSWSCEASIPSHPSSL